MTRLQPSRPVTATDLRSLLAVHAARLEAAGVEHPLHDAMMLAEHVLQRPAAQLRHASLPDAAARASLDLLVARRADREPLQLLMGMTWFRELRLECRPGVFVPRPETEIVAGLAIAAARDAGKHPVVVEPCTGTGAIALAVGSEVAGAQVVAIDQDPAAVELTRANREHVESGWAQVAGLAPGAACTILEGDLFEPLDQDLRSRVDVVVCNPPYLPADDRATLPPEVADHEPAGALFGGSDGLAVIRRLIDQAPHWLRPGATLVLELDPRCADAATELAVRRGLVDVRIQHDLTGTDRALVARATRQETR